MVELLWWGMGCDGSVGCPGKCCGHSTCVEWGGGVIVVFVHSCGVTIVALFRQAM